MRRVLRRPNRMAMILAAGMLLMSGLAPGQSARASVEPSSVGTEFWLTFLPSDVVNGLLSRSLFIASEVGADGTVAVPGLDFETTFSVGAGGIVEVKLLISDLMGTGDGDEKLSASLVELPRLDADGDAFDGVVDLGIKVSADAPVSVYVLSESPFVSDAMLGLPTSALGREYWFVGWTDVPDAGGSLAVVGTEDATTVTIVPAVDTRLRTEGESYDVELDEGQIYHLVKFGGDLSGARIVSDKPVGVFAGNACVRVPNDVDFCDNLMSMLPPVTSWGQDFAVMNLAGRPNSGFLLRAMAARNGTELTVQAVGGESTTVTLDAGEFYESDAFVDVPVSVSSSGPVLLAQYARSGDASGRFNSNSATFGDPFMTIIPPSQQYLTGYTISTASDRFVLPNPDGGPDVSSHFVSLITTAEGRGQVTVNGDLFAALDATEWVQISGTLYGTNVRLVPGAHRIQTSGEPLGVSVYGFRADESYGYPGGLNLRSIVPESLTETVTDAPPVAPTVPDAPPTAPVNVDSYILANGEIPRMVAGTAAWQQADGTAVPLAVSSPAANQVRYAVDGLQVTFTGADGTSVANGLVANPNGEIECEVCAVLAAGGVIEAWMFSTPRLVAAHRIEDLPCQRFSIPVVAPLDGGGPVTSGAHTLQLALPTASGMQAVNVGVTVGGPVPASVPAGEGSVPSGVVLLGLIGAAGAVVAGRRLVTAG